MEDDDFTDDPMYFILGCLRGTEQYIEVVKYVSEKMLRDIYYEEMNTGNGYLHVICQVSEEEYCKNRVS